MEGSVLTGRYRLDRLAGSGGMGQVWQARDLALDRDVAVKVMAMPADDCEAGERFLREARATARLSHPGIVSVFDMGRAADGRYFLVMELVRGESLAVLLRRVGRLPSATVADIGAQVAAALAVAHAAGVVHRDVKPANLLMTADGTVKVVDFGIALLADESSDPLTRAGTLLGTASYTAPERAQGHGATPATDLYALGCVLYRALAGRPPFEAGTAAQLLFQHCYQDPEPIEAWCPDVPPGMANAVRRLMEKDPGRRPADATTASAVLSGSVLSGSVLSGSGEAGAERARAGEPGGTRLMPTVSMSELAGPRAPAPRLGRRGRLVGATIATLVVAVGAFLVGQAVNGGSTATPGGHGSLTPAESTEATGRPVTPAARRTSAETPSDLVAALTARLTGPAAPSGHAATEDLRRQLSQIGERLAAGKFAEAAGKLRDLRRRLEDARRKGDWSGDPVTERLLDRLSALLPAGPDGPGGPGGPGGPAQR